MLQSKDRVMTSEAKKINKAGRIPSEEILAIFKQKHAAFHPHGVSRRSRGAAQGCQVGVLWGSTAQPAGTT